MTDYKPGNLVRLREEMLIERYDLRELNGGIGLVIEVVPLISGMLMNYYKILFGEEKYLFRADEIELL